jgi:uncharacterized membrane protein YqjE
MERTDRDDARRFVMRDGDRRQLVRDGLDDASIGELFKRLTSDASLLVRQEMSLAKAEVQESVAEVKTMVVKLAIAAAFAIPGAIALTAFLVIALGDAINSYWASALIVGALLLGTAGLLAKQGVARVKTATENLQATAASLGEDARWGKEEVKAFKRELTA